MGGYREMLECPDCHTDSLELVVSIAGGGYCTDKYCHHCKEAKV